MNNLSAVERLKRQYFQLLDPEQLTLPPPEDLRLPEVQTQIFDDLFNELRLTYSPPERYKFRVLKRIVGALGEAIVDPDEDEISDDLSSSLAQYISQSLLSASAAAQQKIFLTYTAPTPSPNAARVTLLEAPSLLASSGTTGFRTWEAALFLGVFLTSEQGKSLVAGKRIIELGAGTGFLSILCAKHLGAKYVLVTDGSREVVTDAKANLHFNGLQDGKTIKVGVLEWGHALIGGAADCRQKDEVFDLVVGADVTYDQKSIPALLATLRDLFELYPKLQVLISATVRNEATIKSFLDGCDPNDLSLTDLNIPLPSSTSQTGFFIPVSTPIRVYMITCTGEAKDPFAP